MSHFTVLVIGDDPELQLAPYHEYECTSWSARSGCAGSLS